MDTSPRWSHPKLSANEGRCWGQLSHVDVVGSMDQKQEREKVLCPAIYMASYHKGDKPNNPGHSGSKDACEHERPRDRYGTLPTQHHPLFPWKRSITECFKEHFQQNL